jgi:hypothetical protein
MFCGAGSARLRGHPATIYGDLSFARTELSFFLLELAFKTADFGPETRDFAGARPAQRRPAFLALLDPHFKSTSSQDFTNAP